MRYVLGLAFSENRQKVLLMNKLHPDWQKGLLNGVGGKMSEKEPQRDAMVRECKEETNLDLPWQARGTLCGKKTQTGEAFIVYLFYAFSDKIYLYQKYEEEYPTIRPVLDLIMHPEITLANVPFLIQYGLCQDSSYEIIVRY